MAAVKLTGPAFPFIPYDARFSAGGGFFVINKSQDLVAYYPRVYQINNDGTYSLRGGTGTISAAINAIGLSPDGQYLAGMFQYGNKCSVWKWDGGAYQPLVDLPRSTYGSVASFNDDGSKLAIGGWDGIDIYTRSGDTFTLLASIPNNSGNLNSIQVEDARFSPDGNYLAVVGRGGMQVYFVGTAATRVYSRTVASWGCAWSADSKHVAFGGVAVSSGLWIVGLSGSGSSTTGALVAPGALNSWQNQDSGGWLQIGGKEYYLAFQDGGSVATGYAFYDRDATYAVSSLTLDTAGILGMTGTGAASADVARNVDGTQCVLVGRSTGMQVWQFGPPAPPTNDITGDLSFPKLELAGTLRQVSSFQGDISFAALTLSGAVAQDDDNAPVVHLDSFPAFAMVTTGTGGVVCGPAPPFIFGDIDFPKLTVGGLILQGNGVWGNIDFPKLETSGRLDQDNTLSGELSFAPLGLTGSLFAGFNLSGDIDFPVLTPAGLIVQDNTLEGDIDLPALELDGALNYRVTISGDIDLPALGLDARLVLGAIMTGDIDLPALELAGDLVSGYLVSGNIDLPMLEADGRLDQDNTLEGDIDLPAMEAEGVLAYRYNIDANITLPRLEFAGVLRQINGLAGDLTFKPLEIDGLLRAFVNLSGDIDLPALELDGVLHLINFAHGDIDLSALEIDGRLDQDNTLEGDIDLPMLELDGELSSAGYELSGDIDFPALQFEAVVGLLDFIEGDIDLPALALDGLIAQDNTLEGDLSFAPLELEGFLGWSEVLSGSLEFPALEAEGVLVTRYLIDGGVDFKPLELAGTLNYRLNLSGDLTFKPVEIDGFLWVGPPPEPGEGGTGMGTSGGGVIGAPAFRFGQNNRTRIG